MKRQTIKGSFVQTIDWFEDSLIDWSAAGTKYYLDDRVEQLYKFHCAFYCDSAISSVCGTYSFLFQKLGTKGLLLKKGVILREINRSYYHASVYEYPAAFVTYRSKVYLVHCPIKYCQLDFEDAETGEIYTNTFRRKPMDFFHSRLEVSPDNRHLISKGWYWHPWDCVLYFDLEKCFDDATQLDRGSSIPRSWTEISTASFINDTLVLVGASDEPSMDDEEDESVPPGHLAIWNIKTDEVSQPVKAKGSYGNLFAIDESNAWDMLKYPKIINLISGEEIEQCLDIDSGMQNSSIIHHIKSVGKIAFNRRTKQMAIVIGENIEVLSPGA